MVDEVETKNSAIKIIDVSIHEVCKSICKITYKDKIATGFFIKLFKNQKELLCLMTCYQVIPKEMVDSTELINVKYNYEKKWFQIKLDNTERFIKHDKDMDITVIEIIPSDKIKEKYFLFPNLNNNDLILKNIFIPQFPDGKKLSISTGKIRAIKNYDFYYDASTKKGSTGSPIFLKNTTEVIGIHKKESINKSENIGTLLYSFTLLFQDEKGEKKIKENKTKIIGRYDYSDGLYFIGEGIDGLPNGKGELYDKNNNLIYEGDFVINQREGYGKYFYNNGFYYIGEWKNDEATGKGKVYNNIDILIYEGDFVNGKKEGNGKNIFKSGDYYIGQFKNDIFNGKGILYRKDGSIAYDGDYIDGKYEGNGTLFFDDGKYYYVGAFKSGMRHGKGILFKKNGDIVYDGDFVNGKYEGNGKFIYEDGRYYIGQFKNDKRHGEGILFEKDGRIKYEGNFSNDSFDGDGKVYYDNGNVYEGEFLNFLRHGKGKLYDKDGNIIYEGNFVNNKYENQNGNGSENECSIF